MGQNEKNIAFYNIMMSIKTMSKELGLNLNDDLFKNLYNNYKNNELNQCEENINLLNNQLKKYETILQGHRIYKETQLLFYMCERAKIN
jgi:hypothetical protein